MVRPPREKRLNGVRFLLTYPQSSEVSIDELADFISSLPNFLWLEIVQENHHEHGIHYHAVVVFAERVQGNMRFFDFAGRHCNIQAIRNATTDLVRCRHYIRKGAERTKEDEHDIASHKKKACDYIIEPDTRGEPPEYIATSGRLNWGGILAESKSREEFYSLMRLHQPKEWIMGHRYVEYYADKFFAPEKRPEAVYPPSSWIVPSELDAWCNEVFSEVSISLMLTHKLFCFCSVYG